MGTVIRRNKVAESSLYKVRTVCIEVEKGVISVKKVRMEMGNVLNAKNSGNRDGKSSSSCNKP